MLHDSNVANIEAYQNFLKIIEENTLIKEIDDNKMEYYINYYMDMRNFQLNFAWAIPSEYAINEIIKFSRKDKVLEIGSGLGLWCHLLQLNGLDIIGTDNFSSHTQKEKERFCKIEEISAIDATNKYIDRNVLMTIWPPMSSMVSDALKIFKGNKLIYIGEPEGGCTGDESFFDILEKYWVKIDIIKISQWRGICDGLHIYLKK